MNRNAQITVAIDTDVYKNLFSLRIPGEQSYQDVVKKLLEKELKESAFAKNIGSYFKSR